MNRNRLKTYAPQARRDFINAVTDRAARLGIIADKGKLHVEPIQEQGDVALIQGQPYPRKVAAQRRRLEARIRLHGFEPVMEAMAYTWFNRLVAIRFMEVNGYLDHGYRVLSPSLDEGRYPELLEQAEHVALPGLDQGWVIDCKLAGNRDEALYRRLLIGQCNALSDAMPFLFERIDDETELLLPDNLLHSDSLIRKLVAAVPEEDWREIEIVGWLYQFYISEKKDQVIGKVVASEDIPAATQLFTPNWIVKYLLQNSLGRQWLATYSDSAVKNRMAYYIEPAEQTEAVQRQLAAITPQSLDPEAIAVLDPACGSGHILVEAYDLMKAIYQERGYRSRDIPALILARNLYGLDIDDRAAQLAAFALMMKARADDRRIFERRVKPNVLAIQESKGLDGAGLARDLGIHHGGTEAQRKEFLNQEAFSVSPRLCGANDIADLLELFEHGKTFGSLITVPESLRGKLPALHQRVEAAFEGRYWKSPPYEGGDLEGVNSRQFIDPSPPPPSLPLAKGEEQSNNAVKEEGAFVPDADGIIPITEIDWFQDDVAHRLVEFIKVTWDVEKLTENLKFVADSLDPKRGETPLEALRRHLAGRFYKDHLQTYKRRPIYWLFTSGKQGAFQALVYLHRYHEGTVARMRMEYVIPLQGRIGARIEQLDGDIAAAGSTAARKKLEKERDTLLKQQLELSDFDDRLRHFADRRIGLDLDDGVKVNYGKFSDPEVGELLAEVKAVTGKSEPESETTIYLHTVQPSQRRCDAQSRHPYLSAQGHSQRQPSAHLAASARAPGQHPGGPAPYHPGRDGLAGLSPAHVPERARDLRITRS